MNSVLYVALGGGIGAASRYMMDIAIGRTMGSGFPYGTMSVNILGSLLMGLLIGWMSMKINDGQSLRLFLATGILGGFTTFSAFSLDAITLFERKAHAAFAAYVAGSVILAILALMIGLWISRKVFA